ncbi:MAG: hypothetical protein E5V75_19925 [Mesorhizobium sp.]|nr:MAG: hypothetical protein E5V75_19925 [Mesorhizobium sp.]
MKIVTRLTVGTYPVALTSINKPVGHYEKMSIFYAPNRIATMHEDEGSTPDKLQAMLDVIARSEPSSGEADVGRMQADAIKAANVLIEFYADAALERAKLIERRSPQSHFARMVTAEVGRRGRLPPRS